MTTTLKRVIGLLLGTGSYALLTVLLAGCGGGSATETQQPAPPATTAATETTVACAVEVEVDSETRNIRVLEVCEAFECGKVLNPNNLRSQIEGAIVMGLGPALSEEMCFDDKRITNASFRSYRVPHFRDVPKIETILIDRPDLTSVGAGETPIIVVAPAIANAVFHATGQRLRDMPLKLA